MKDVPQLQIDSTRKYFESQKFPVEQIMVSGKLFNYYVIPQSLNTDIPDFSQRATNPNDHLFGVSDRVPQTLRPYWAMHEIIEFTQIGIDKKGRCVEAERLVFEEVPSELKNEFVERRIKFFSNVIDYFKKEIGKSKDDFTVDDIKEAEGSLHFLQDTQKVEQ